MSFPKAKLHRFNEEVSCAPPPGRYDPKLDTKVKGAAMQISKRFPDQMCSSSSLDCLNMANPAQITFRTPQVIKKKVALTPRLQYLQKKNFDTPGSGSSDSSSKDFTCKRKTDFSRADYVRLEQELFALTDKYQQLILESNLEISELKENLQAIKTREEEMTSILFEKSVLVSNRSKELLEVKNNLDTLVEKISNERQDNQKYIEKLKEEIAHLQFKKEDMEGILKEKLSVMVTMNDTCLSLQRQLEEIQRDKENYKKELLQMKETSSEILEKVVGESELQINSLEEKLKSKVECFERLFDDVQQKVEVEYNTKFNFVCHKFDLERCEIKTQMEKCLKRVKELQENVDQKTKAFSKDIQEADERCKYMYRELCKVEGQRDELLVSDLEKKLAVLETEENAYLFEKDLEQCRNKCKIYEITLNTMQETVRALSIRLLESDSEVERLSKVEVDLESQKTLLEEKSQLLLADVTALRHGMDKMEKDIIYDVAALKNHLEAKVEHFKTKAANQVEALNSKIHEKQCNINSLLMQIESLKTEIEANKKILENKNKKETKQQQYIDKLISDLVFEKERCAVLETEKEKFKSLFSDSKISYSEQSDKVQKLEEAKTTLQMQLVKSSRDIAQLEDDMKKSKEFEIKVAELKSQLSTAKEKMKDELQNLQRDNINKAEYILELSMKIDSLHEKNNESETKITCLHAEKDSLSHQLDEARNKISTLEDVLERKNMTINNLTNQKIIAEDSYKTVLNQMDVLHVNLNNQNEQLRLDVDKDIKISEAEEKIAELEETLSKLKEELNKAKSESYIEENTLLMEELDDTKLKLQKVIEERERLNQEIAELMGHQNIHQKIKHVNQLKQTNMELRERSERLEIENARLKKKLANYKENAAPRLENSPKSVKPKATIHSSPTVLKDRNH